ncbi:MAG: hypothetical protein IKZ88_07615 [Neisseriaceae bacterium]|nr:hypothetical protein [Neisseriaceae bacterium]
MIKKMVFSVLIGSSLLCLSACEDKAEKRAKLEAQYKEYHNEAAACSIPFSGVTKEKCDEWREKEKQAKAELDKLNGIKK